MKTTTTNGRAQQRRPKKTTEQHAAAELEQLEAQDHDHEAGVELAARFAAERLHLEIQHQDRVRGLENQHAAELARLDARQAQALIVLWRAQGRTIGPWAERMIKGVRNGTPG